MKVFKFGGASISDFERIKNVGQILEAHKGEQILIIVSALGKTTNALEKVAEAFYKNKVNEALSLFEKIKKDHITLAKYLLVTHYLPCEQQLKDFFTEAEWLLHDKPVKSFAYYYDQIVCIGELLSSTIVSYYLNEIKINNKWMDVRDIIRTDANFKEANIDWEYTATQTEKQIAPYLDNEGVVLTQGFIAATDENESTTLGREGSDYTAAVFANILNAECQIIWKDVASVMNADPREVPDAISLPELNYTEVIEMAYYGAQIIHPKTIKPLQNKSIPLLVKCFLDPNLPGTIIHNSPVKDLPPIIVIKKNQVMVELKLKDFSFVGEHQTSLLYQLFESLSIHPNLTQHGAISMIYAFDNREDKINALASKAAETFDVQITPSLTLLTIRHYNNEVQEKYLGDKTPLVKQQTIQNLRALY
ncbi:MAG: aspartate kinase [Niabella sp.]